MFSRESAAARAETAVSASNVPASILETVTFISTLPTNPIRKKKADSNADTAMNPAAPAPPGGVRRSGRVPVGAGIRVSAGIRCLP